MMLDKRNDNLYTISIFKNEIIAFLNEVEDELDTGMMRQCMPLAYQLYTRLSKMLDEDQ